MMMVDNYRPRTGYGTQSVFESILNVCVWRLTVHSFTAHQAIQLHVVDKQRFTEKSFDVVGVVLRERAELDVTVKQTDLYYVASVASKTAHHKTNDS